MTVHERLEKLTIDLDRLRERHEALTQSVELMGATHSHHLELITHNFEVALDSIKRLENIAGSHEQPIQDLDDKH